MIESEQGGEGGDLDFFETGEPDEETLRLRARAALRKERQDAWDVERNNGSGQRFELSQDLRTAVLGGDHAGKWHSICSDVSFETGVHFMSVRVSYSGASACPSPSLSSAWMLGVASRNCPLNMDVHKGGDAFGKVAVCAGIDSRDIKDGAFWSLMYRNHQMSPYQDGQIVACPSSIVHGLKNGDRLKHNGRIYDGDVIGIKADLDEQTVTFFVNGERIRKPVSCKVGGQGWVVLLASATPAVKFTILTNPDPEEDEGGNEERNPNKDGKKDGKKIDTENNDAAVEASLDPWLIAPWGAEELEELEEAGKSGAKSLCHFERDEETEKLRDALMTGDPNRIVRKLVEGGAFSEASWALGLSATHSQNGFRTLLDMQSANMLQHQDMPTNHPRPPADLDAGAPSGGAGAGADVEGMISVEARSIEAAAKEEHALARKAREQRAKVHEMKAELAAASQEARTAKDALERARVCLSELKDAESSYEGLDMSLRMQNVDEERRLKKLLSECEAAHNLAVSRLESEQARVKTEARSLARFDQRVKEMQEHTKSMLYRLHTPISDHLRQITSPQPTFSAADQQTAASNIERRKLGAKVADNECLVPKRDQATGALSVIVHCPGLASDKIRIHYTTDGRNPTSKSPSIGNGKTISITSTCTIKAIAIKNLLEPSSVAISANYIVRCSQPEFKSSSTTGNKSPSKHSPRPCPLAHWCSRMPPTYFTAYAACHPPSLLPHSFPLSLPPSFLPSFLPTIHSSSFSQFLLSLSHPLSLPFLPPCSLTCLGATPSNLQSRPRVCDLVLAGKNRIRVQMTCKTPGVKIHYALNSPEDAPLEWAVDGGTPIKESPYGTGPGKRDGTMCLIDPKTGEPAPLSSIAGSIDAYDTFDVACSARIHAMASKHGMADSNIVISELYLVEGR